MRVTWNVRFWIQKLAKEGSPIVWQILKKGFQDIPWSRALFSLYVVAVFEVLLFMNREIPIPGQELFPFGPLAGLGKGVYGLGLCLFLFSVFLPRLLKELEGGKTRALEGCLSLAGAFWLLSILGWLGSRISLNSLAHFIAFGGFFGIIEGIYRVPFRPHWLKDTAISIEGKKELLKYENTKWWQGLAIFWALIISIVVTGLLSYSIALPKPVGETREAYQKGLAILLIPAGCSIPGIAMVVWNVIKRTNLIQEELAKLYKNKAGNLDT
jgi:hypothetical protein